jgi:ABC-type oligopeptide transport system substrate-binding subunit
LELPFHQMFSREDHTNWDVGYFLWFPDYSDPGAVLNFLLSGPSPTRTNRGLTPDL